MLIPLLLLLLFFLRVASSNRRRALFVSATLTTFFFLYGLLTRDVDGVVDLVVDKDAEADVDAALLTIPLLVPLLILLLLLLVLATTGIALAETTGVMITSLSLDSELLEESALLSSSLERSDITSVTLLLLLLILDMLWFVSICGIFVLLVLRFVFDHFRHWQN